MKIKKPLLEILAKSRETELGFIGGLDDEARAELGTYEKWSAKDNVAHANYWSNLRIARINTWITGGELDHVPQFEEANVGIFEEYAEKPWDEVLAFAAEVNQAIVEIVTNLSEDQLTGSSLESDYRSLWDAIVSVSYTHKLSHFAQYYLEHGQKEHAAQLWKDWAELVSPMDDGPEWQGAVHYNAACSLALTGDADGALAELEIGLELRPGLKGWSRLDSDLVGLHDDPRFQKVFAGDHWWEALRAGAQAEALADQFLRSLFMLRAAVSTLADQEWVAGETLYQRPVGMALHAVQAIDTYAVFKHGESSKHDLAQANWQDRDTGRFPSRDEFIGYLDVVEQRLAHFLATTELEAQEELFPWTGKTVLSRMLYTLRHTQHHLADLAMELQRRGLRPPDWQ